MMKGFLKFSDQKGSLVTVLLVCLGLIAFFISAIVFGVWIWVRLMNNFPAYHTAKNFLSNHPQVEEQLGSIEEWDSFPWGRINYNKRSGTATIHLDLTGSKTKGRVTLVLVNEFENPWVVDKASLKFRGQKEPVEMETPEQWLNTALDYLKKRNFSEAQEKCELIQKAVPEDYRDEVCFAEIALTKGEKERFLEIRKSLSDKNPNYDRYQVFLAYAYFVLDDIQKSIEHYNKAWDLNPNPETASSLAYIYLNNKENNKA